MGKYKISDKNGNITIHLHDFTRDVDAEMYLGNVLCKWAPF